MICGFGRGSGWGLVWPLQNNQLVIFVLEIWIRSFISLASWNRVGLLLISDLPVQKWVIHESPETLDGVHGDKKGEGQFVNSGLWISKKLRLDSVWLCISTKPYSYPPYWIFLHVQKLKYFRTISNTAISSSFQIQNFYWIFKFIRITSVRGCSTTVVEVPSYLGQTV